jgi:hypothetical protein
LHVFCYIRLRLLLRCVVFLVLLVRGL